MTDPNPIEPRGCPTPGACSAVEVIERLQKDRDAYKKAALYWQAQSPLRHEIDQLRKERGDLIDALLLEALDD